MAIVALAGCDLYFGADDTVCESGGGGYVDGYIEYWDPNTGTCVPGGSGYYCDDECGPCRGYGAEPDMGLCYSECSSLDEGACLASPGCHAAYRNDPITDGGRDFIGCSETSPSGPVQGTCNNLSAHECARHDDCSLVYNQSTFAVCVPEPVRTCLDTKDCGEGTHCDFTTCYMDPCPDCPTCGACADVCHGVCVPDEVSCTNVDCGPGYHCEEQCYPTDGNDGPPQMSYCTTACVPDLSSCALLDCAPGYECVETCELTGNGTLWCGASCVPAGGDPGSCSGDVLCDALPPQCPMGTTAGILNGCWSGYCIPNEDCGPHDPGECYGAVACDALPPACPSGTTAGVLDGCWTGYCIPDAQCEQSSCASLTTEAACQARWDCTPVYTGTNCTCTANGCTCQTLTFNRCDAAYMPL